MGATPTSFVLVTGDATFGILFRHAVASNDALDCRAVVPPARALAAVREAAPDHVLLDLDGQPPGDLVALCRKVVLVRPVRITVMGAQAGPASPAAAEAMRAMGVRFLEKPATAAGLDLGDAATAESFGAAVVRHLAPGAA